MSLTAEELLDHRLTVEAYNRSAGELARVKAELAEMTRLHDIEVGRRQRADAHREEVQAELAGAHQEAAAAKRERDELRAQLEMEIEAADQAVEASDTSFARAHEQAEELRAQLEVAQGQVKVTAAALRGAEQGREAAMAIAAVFRQNLESWLACANPVESTQRLLKDTEELAQAFVQGVREKFEAELIGALRGGEGIDSPATVSKEFAAALAASFDKAQHRAVDEALRGVEDGLLKRFAARFTPDAQVVDDAIERALAAHEARVMGLIAKWLAEQPPPWAPDAAALVAAVRRAHELRSGLEVTP